jgi:hypothetical protein
MCGTEFERGLPMQRTATHCGCGSGCWTSSRSEEGARSELRGGAWNNESRNLRAANRNRNEPENRNDNIGFRCARDVERVRLCRDSYARAGATRVVPGVHLHFRTVRLTRGMGSASNSEDAPAVW